MKLTKRVRSLISVVMALLMIVSVVSIGIVAASGASALTISYGYLYKNAGYAQGKLRLSAESSAYGTYYLYWADDTKALDGYAEITKMTLSSSKTYRNFTFGEFTAIPAGATKIIAIKSTTEPTTKTVDSASAVYDIPAEKQFKHNSSEIRYNFQALSDVHIHKQNPPYYLYSEQHLADALSAAAERDADFVTVCGDAINGYDNLYNTEWAAYLKVIADSPYCNPIYETNGNHETKSDSKNKDADTPYTTGINTYKAATGLNVTTGTMPANSYYEVTAPNGDHFIFMVLELDSSPNESNEFTEAQMTWLKGLLSKYYGDGHNIFLYEHALISGYGAGDNEVVPLYGGSLMDTYPTVREFISLLEKYPDIFWLSGHTHIDFKYGYNFTNRGGTTAYSVHIPSTSSTTQVKNGSLDYVMDENSSQGYFVDVYDDAVVFNGTDLVNNKYLPAYIYFVDQNTETLIKNDDIIDDDEYPTATVTVDVSYLAPDPEYVYCYAYSDTDDLDNNGYPGTAMTKNTDGTFSCEISTGYDHMTFIFKDAKLGRLGSNEYEINNCKVVIGADRIVYNNPSKWSNVYAYVWSDKNTSFEWPGILMTKDAESGQYVAYVPADTFTKIIFTNGSGSKTGDLNIAPYLSGSIKGSYTVTDPIVRPTDSTENTEIPTTAPTTDTSNPTQPSSTASTEPTAAETTSPVIAELIYGDANEDGHVNIKDATTIQKAAADLIVLGENAKKQADVNGDGNVNVIDATYVQKLCASLIVRFPVESKSVNIAEVGATSSELATLISSVKTTLADDYKYASYDAYMALKKAYYNYKDKSVSSMTAAQIDAAYAEIDNALADFNKMKSNNPGIAVSGGGTSTDTITVYFSDAQSWGSTIYVHYWGSSNTSWPGKQMTFVRNNSSGQAIYMYDIPAGTTGLVFHNNKGGNSNQTIDVVTDIANGKGFYASSKESSGKWSVTAYDFAG